MSQMVNTGEAASHLGLQKSTLDKWRSEGCGPPFVRVGRLVMYRPEDLNDWIESQVVQFRHASRAPKRTRPRKRASRT